MTIILLILTSAFISALLMGSFALGYYFAMKKDNKDQGMELTHDNAEMVSSMLDFIGYNGQRGTK